MERKISCTPENVEDFRAMVQRWPELAAMVRALQAQNLFPGLRAMQITLTGGENTLAKGLAAIPLQNAPEAAKPAAPGEATQPE